MAKWCVKIRQIAKETSNLLNEFDLTVDAKHRQDAINAALVEIKKMGEGLQAYHVQDNPFANAQRRPYRKLAWSSARNVVVYCTRVKDKK